MKKINKTLLSVGTIASAVAPVAAVVSCGGEKKDHFNLLPTYTGQADQLIALGIHSDYYPLQLNEDNPYAYLTNPGQYMVKQSEQFKTDFKNKLADLMPSKKGTSWWNQDALASDEAGSDPSYWQEKEAGVLLYEHYLLDDDRKVVSSSIAPKANPFAAVQTNFRASRDPYTRTPRGVFFGWDLLDATIEKMLHDTDLVADDIKDANGKALPGVAIASGNKNVEVTIDGTKVTVTKVEAKIIKALRDKRKNFLNQDNHAQAGESDWLYNDWYFVDSFHRMFLDNKDLQSGGTAHAFKEWLFDTNSGSAFTASHEQSNKNTGTDHFDEDIKKLFDASTFQADEVGGGIGPRSTASPHHPIYEQQEGEVGAAPMFEGAMRDNQLYLFNVAWQISNLVKYGTPFGEQHLDELPDTSPSGTKTDNTFAIANSKAAAARVKAYVKDQVSASQLAEMEKALDNAVAITSELKTRMDNLKTYFAALGLANKKFGMLTVAPGHGQSTIQSMSKYSFLYRELGFAQPIPTNLDALAAKADTFTNAWTGAGTGTATNPNLDSDGKITSGNDAEEAIGEGSIFNMDDNGWFWTMGETGSLSQSRLQRFAGQFDMGVVAARDANYQSEISGNAGVKGEVDKLFSISNSNADDHKVDYDLWNEGLKTPFVMHMILDQVQKAAEDYYLASDANHTEQSLTAIQNNNSNKYTEATDWGNYFTHTFLGK